MIVEYTVRATKPTTLYGLLLEPYEVCLHGDVAVVRVAVESDDHEWHRIEEPPAAPVAVELLTALGGAPVAGTYDGRVYLVADELAGVELRAWRPAVRGARAPHHRLEAALQGVGEVLGSVVVDDAPVVATVEDAARAARLAGPVDVARAVELEAAAELDAKEVSR